MSSRTKPSYDIKSQPILTPSQNYELEPDNTAPKSSYDLTRPTEGFPTDYVSRTYGGSFYGLVKYNSGYSITDNFHLVYKSWVEDYVATSIAELEAGGLSKPTILGWLSSAAGTPLTYNNATGVFTLDKDLSQYNNATSAFITLADIPAETDPVFSAWDKSTGISITLSQVSDWEEPTIIETDPVFTASPSAGITSTDITNWTTAYGWGDHSTLYDPINTASGLVSTHESTFNHSLISTALQDITGESVHSLSDFPALGTSLQFLRVDSDGLGLEFHTIGHGDLSEASMNSNDAYLHLTSAEKANISQPATILTHGYMTSAQVEALENALTAFTPGINALGAELVYNESTNTLTLADDIPTLDDASTDASHVLSASKILSLFEGSTEEGGYAKSYTISIPAGADLATKLGFTATVPTGWSLSANGANLEITHNVGKTPVGIAVYRITSIGTKQKLEGNTAYSNATSNSTGAMLTLSAYAGTTDATEIRLSF